MKGLLLFFLLFSYVEKRDGVERYLTARRDGDEIFIDALAGKFPDNLRAAPPWYLSGFDPSLPTLTLLLEGLPPLTLRRDFDPDKPGHYRLHLQSRSEVIPLNEEEALKNAELRPFGVREIRLEGEGRLKLDADGKKDVAEEFVLSGTVVREDKTEALSIQWAFGSQY